MRNENENNTESLETTKIKVATHPEIKERSPLPQVEASSSATSGVTIGTSSEDVCSSKTASDRTLEHIEETSDERSVETFTGDAAEDNSVQIRNADEQTTKERAISIDTGVSTDRTADTLEMHKVSYSCKGLEKPEEFAPKNDAKTVEELQLPVKKR